MKKAESTAQTYVKPELVSHGSFSRMTLGSSEGERLDEAFPAGTPRGELTFS